MVQCWEPWDARDGIAPSPGKQMLQCFEPSPSLSFEFLVFIFLTGSAPSGGGGCNCITVIVSAESAIICRQAPERTNVGREDKGRGKGTFVIVRGFAWRHYPEQEPRLVRMQV